MNTSDNPGVCLFKHFVLYEAVCSNYHCIGGAVCGRCATDGDGDVGMIINVPAFKLYFL